MDVESWDKRWEKHEKYTRNHQVIWDYFQSLGVWSGNIVDLGCGPCVMYQGKTVSLVGIDWSVEALRQARLHYPYGTYIQGDVSNTGLPTGQFDTIVACGLLDYFEDWNTVIMEARRLLKPGGKLYATLLNGFGGHDWTKYPKIAGNWHLCVL